MNPAPLFEEAGEQLALPGIPAARQVEREDITQPPLMALVGEDEPPWPLTPVLPTTGQLSIGANQMQLSDHEPAPVQLSLIEEPMVWEQPDRPVKKTRKRKPTARRGPKQSPGQESLF